MAVWDALERGDLDSAWQIFTRVLPLLRSDLQPGMGVSAMKPNLMALDASSLAERRDFRRSEPETTQASDAFQSTMPI